MATNPSIKKSSIPRSTHDCDRPDPTKSRLKGHRPPVSKSSFLPHHSVQPGPHEGLLKEDQDAVSRSLLELECDQAKMSQTLEDTVQDAEERLAAMEKLLAEREKLMAANMEAAKERMETLENQVEDYEKKLIESNIDPVTGEAQEPTLEQTATVKTIRKVTKGDVTRMREKLHQMNKRSDKFLTDVQNIIKDIEELENTSQRISKTSQFDGLSGTNLRALICEVEEAQKKEEQQKTAKKKKEDAEEEEEEREEEKQKSPWDNGKNNVQLPAKPDTFITQKRDHTA